MNRARGLVYHRLAAANVVGRIFDVVRTGKPARQVQAGDIETNAAGGLQNLDIVFFDFYSLIGQDANHWHDFRYSWPAAHPRTRHTRDSLNRGNMKDCALISAIFQIRIG